MMKEKFDIRELEVKDVLKIVTLVRTSFHTNYIKPSIYRGQGVDRFILSELENQFSPYKYFVLYVNNKVAAYTEYKIFSQLNMVFLNIIAVSNNFKNQKFGSIIFEFSRDYFKKKGFKTIQLDVYSTNTVAINWYTKYGFNRLSSNFFYKMEMNKKHIENNIIIKNFPQFKVMKSTLGFSFLETSINNEDFNFGIIEDDIFVRGKYDYSISCHIAYISKILNMRNIYYIGNEALSSESNFIDKIERMELNL